ncbi:MAG: selenocysteine-specific translation elongation factor [Alphaproteobacteria bacterium]|nr:selenocysteine-specific translation elongation factor [Alphaproteobacteria bacterium]
MIIGTAGHVDHGKTALVRALTGVPGDRLPEERRRGMTIDLGYAYAGDWGFIDVPGHERLVATMLAGAGGIDAALLVVAADEGVMPQTVEHARILDLLGIDRGVVALTRIDLPGAAQAAVEAEVRALLAGTGLAQAPVLPVSSTTGAGVAALRAALAAIGARPRDAAGYPRLAVDRAFTVAGAGLVVTGTLVAGAMTSGDRLMLSPAGIAVRVRGLHAHNRPAEAATAGARVALNITGAERAQVVRGDWVLHPEIHAPTAMLDAALRLLPGAPVPAPGAGLAVHLHLAAAHVTARLVPLAPGLARLHLDRAIGALAGDRFVLRDAAAARTIGGGVVLDPFPPRRGARTPGRLHLLAAQVQPALPALAAMLAEGPVALAPFCRARNLRPEAQPDLLRGAGAVALGGFAMHESGLAALRRDLLAALGAHHAAHPDEPGLPPARLRGRLPPPLFAALLTAALRRGEIEQDGPWLRLPAHRVVLSPAEERRWAELRSRIAAERFRPPRTRDLAAALGMPEGALRTLLKRLTRLGRLVEVAHDHFFLPATLAEIVAIAAGIERASGHVTAAALRDALDNGRKVAIQILEFLDAAGLTRRAGDLRRLRPERLHRFGPPPA